MQEALTKPGKRYQALTPAQRKAHNFKKNAARRSDVRHRLLDAARWRARDRGLPCDLVLEDILVPDTCPILGISLKAGVRVTDASPSLDRVINELGYVRGNVRVISHKANRIKSNASLHDVLAVADYIRNCMT